MDEARQTSTQTERHDAFISYAREDALLASTLERALEGYRPPRDLKVSQRPLDVFRDEQDFTGGEYYSALDRHLAASNRLIVLCSPHARASRFVDDEIERFAASRGAENIIPVLADGIPNNEASAGDAERVAFPEALCRVMEMPRALNYTGFEKAGERPDRGVFENAWYDLLAEIYGLSRRIVEQRDKKRRLRLWRLRAGLAGVVFVALTALSAWALLERDRAIEQRDLAEERSRVALSRQLALESRAVSGRSVETAALVALAGYRVAPTPQARRALLDALNAQPRLERSFRAETRSGALAAALSPDGRLLLTGGCARYASNRVDCAEGLLQVWDVASGKPLAAPLSAHEDRVTAVAFLDGGRRFASASARDASVVVWETSTLRRVDGFGLALLSLASSSGINASFSRDGRLLAVGTHDGTVRVWNLERGGLEGRARVFEPDPAAGLIQLDDGVASLAFSDDGGRLVAGSTGGEVAVLRVDGSVALEAVFEAHAGSVHAVVFLADGRTLASGGSDAVIRLWSPAGDAYDARELARGKAYGLAGSPDGSLLAVAGPSGVALWRLADSEMLPDSVSAISGATFDVAFAADGRTLLAQGGDVAVLVDATRTPGEGQALPTGLAKVASAAFDETGEFLALGGCARGEGLFQCDAGGIELFDSGGRAPPLGRVEIGSAAVSGLYVASGGDLVRGASYVADTLLSWRPREAGPARESSAATAAQGLVTKTVHAPDGRTAAMFGCGVPEPDSTVYCQEGLIEIWDTERIERTGASMRAHRDTVSAVAFSPDGRWLASGGGDGDVLIWDMQTRSPVGAPMSAGFRDPGRDTVKSVYLLAFSPDGRYLVAASGGSGGAVAWEVDSRRTVARYEGNPLGIAAIAIDPQGRWLAADGSDGNVDVWDLPSGARAFPVLRGLSGSVTALAFAPHGARLVGGDREGHAVAWELDPSTLTERACRLANRDLSEEEWKLYAGEARGLVLCDGAHAVAGAR